MFATAESMVRRGLGAVDIEQIRWMGLQQGTFGLDGLLYSRKGIGVPTGLLPLTWLGLVVPWFGTVSVSLLFNAIVIALTAVLLLAYLQQLGYNRLIGLIVALTFGLATLAWPYAKSLFSDPFAGLLLMAAALMLLKFRHALLNTKTRNERNNPENTISPAPPLPRSLTWVKTTITGKPFLYPFLAGLLLGWNVATRFAEAIFLPVYGLLLLYYLGSRVVEPESRLYRLRLRRPITNPWPPILAFGSPIALIGLGLISFNIFRYGDPFNTGYLPNETFSGVLWDGILGQLISPGRGLLLYCPILLLSLAGVAPFFRRFRAEATLAAGIILIHLLLYGKWFMWHGGYAWGPRFMIPTLPFWAMLLAPVVEYVFTSRVPEIHVDNPESKIQNPHSPAACAGKSKIFRIAFLILTTLSLIPQLLGVTIDFAPFQNALLDTGLPLFARQTFFDPQYSAFIGAWAFITPETLDLAWVWNGNINRWLLVVLVANIAITGFFLWRLVVGRRWGLTDRESPLPSAPLPPHSPSLTLLPYLSTLIATLFLLIHTHALPPKDIKETVATLNQSVRPNDAIITNDPEIAMPFAELYKGRAPVLGLSNGGFPLPEDVTRRVEKTIADHAQIWWLPNWLPPEESAVEQILLAEGLRVRNETLGDQRLVLFAFPPDIPATVQPVGADFAHQITLTDVAYYNPTAKAGTAFPIELHWQAVTPLSEDYHVFIHLLDGDGQIIAQADGQPDQWRRPTSSWRVGETIIDQHGLWIPADTAPGVYNLRIGLYRPADGQRLLLPDGEDSVGVEVGVE